MGRDKKHRGTRESEDAVGALPRILSPKLDWPCIALPPAVPRIEYTAGRRSPWTRREMATLPLNGKRGILSQNVIQTFISGKSTYII
jgi:hypothetical protein